MIDYKEREMKQFQMSFRNAEGAYPELMNLREKTGHGQEDHMLFQVFSGSIDKEAADRIAGSIQELFPGARYVGCSTSGNIINGDLCPDPYSVTCTLFEDPTARIETRQYHLGSENVDKVIREVASFANENLWVKAIMLYTTVWETSMSSLCSELDQVRSGVEILGGGAFNEALDSSSSFVLSTETPAADRSIVFAFIGGDRFSIRTRYISGWKPLGKEMEITKAKGNVLQEIEGVSAFETYRRYLKIENDDTFLYNTLEFPYLIRYHGIDILRHPQQCLKDGSLVMASDVERAGKIRLAYGDPVAIMENVFQNVHDIRREEPDVIAIFSCAGRKAFWGDSEIGNETRAFQMIAPSSGFYTLSEFLRTGENVNQHNLTLVIASMKENIDRQEDHQDLFKEEEKTARRISTVERLANFIEEATRELEAANEQLFDMNQKLSDMAITDGMTQLYNRSEIQKRISEYRDGSDEVPVSLIMLDIDNFKKINDTFGHKEGDFVICTLSALMKEHTAKKEGVSVGRWGGEEFMILLPGVKSDEAFEIAESIRRSFERITFPQAGHRTVSLGVTQRKQGEDEDSLVLRVDQALYTAKNTGKNKSVLL